MSEETKTRLYELAYIIVPTTPEAEVSKEVDTIKSALEKAGGIVHSEGAPEFIDLAYTMEKNIASKKMKWNQGYFGWIKFDCAPEGMEALKKALDANLAVIRYLLIKTNAENTITFKKPKVEAKRGDTEELFEELDEVDAENPEEGNAAADASSLSGEDAPLVKNPEVVEEE